MNAIYIGPRWASSAGFWWRRTSSREWKTATIGVGWIVPNAAPDTSWPMDLTQRRGKGRRRKRRGRVRRTTPPTPPGKAEN